MKEDKSVMEIGLDNRPVNRFIRKGMYWVSDIVKLKTTEIATRIHGIGEVSKKDIIDKIHKQGFVFRDEEGYAEQKIVMPTGLLDMPLAESPYGFYKSFLRTKNIITYRDLINISEE